MNQVHDNFRSRRRPLTGRLACLACLAVLAAAMIARAQDADEPPGPPAPPILVPVDPVTGEMLQVAGGHLRTSRVMHADEQDGGDGGHERSRFLVTESIDEHLWVGDARSVTAG